MKIHIITIFPESFESYFNTSIMKKAKEKKILELIFYKLNNFSDKKTKRVDDKAYGMHGLVISPKPLSKAINHIFDKTGKKLKIVYLTPSGHLLNQEKSEFFLNMLSNEFIIICGHYEGIDQRIIDLYIDYKVSIGEYVLSSGELASMVFIDCLVRQIPGILGNENSFLEDSFSEKLNRQKEYPVYTKPKSFMKIDVPNVLISGNHKEINNWKIKNLS